MEAVRNHKKGIAIVMSVLACAAWGKVAADGMVPSYLSEKDIFVKAHLNSTQQGPNQQCGCEK